MADQAEPINVLAVLAGLRAMTVPELQAKWAAIFDGPAPNASRGNLDLRLGYRLQELALGGLGREARRTPDALADEVANGAPGPMVADPRRPMPGTRLVRDREGIEHSVTVRSDRDVSRIIRLAWLSPSVLEQLVMHREPTVLTPKDLCGVAELPWADQPGRVFDRPPSESWPESWSRSWTHGRSAAGAVQTP